MNKTATDKSESILIVDDTQANLRLLSQLLTGRGYRVRAVTNGARALASVEAETPDLILLDIRMPEMDGYQVCQRLKEMPQAGDVPILFISALDEVEGKMKAFAIGGLDYITKPFQLEEVVARVETHLSLRRLQRTLQEANQRMQRELVLAAQVQASMMRSRLPRLPGWEMVVKLIPAKLTCGDFYDVLHLPAGKIAILIADVVDKGVGAALYMSMSCTLLRTYALEHPDNPEQVLLAVNRRILEDIQTDQFVTVFLGVLDPHSGALAYSNAGHNPPALVRANDEKSVELLAHTGPALGVLEDLTCEQRSVQLHPGDVLVFYTDGVTDAENEARDFYGLDRLLQSVRVKADYPADALQHAILEDLSAFTQDAPQLDDIALMILKRQKAWPAI
jgi:sigma-B regulation protein RsbU (phosphoserine phosphatase)